MGRKKVLKKQTVNVSIKGALIPVTLTPPTGKRRTWYVYWNGLKSSRSTNQQNFDEAVEALPDMIGKGGRRSQVSDVILSDEEFEEIQRRHYAKKTEPAARERSMKSLRECLDAIAAFKAITGLARVAEATPDDCARFQREALLKPTNWRRNYPKGKPTDTNVSPNTVRKWSRTLQAAFERANRNAEKKCVRGIVAEEKLLTSNPWNLFIWIKGRKKPIRQFDDAELRSLLAFLHSKWAGVPLAAIAAKVFLWSCCRRMEVSSLRWENLRLVSGEVHFEVIGKWGVERWFRIPERVYQELLSFRSKSPFVFAAYCDQIRTTHAGNPGCLRKIRTVFDPQNFGRWMYERIKQWSGLQSGTDVDVHVFRKTALQYVHDGQDAESLKSLSSDAGVSKSVLLGHYIKPDLLRQSNRTYRRLVASLPGDLASLYGYEESACEQLQRQLDAARARADWSTVGKLAMELEACSMSTVV